MNVPLSMKFTKRQPLPNFEKIIITKPHIITPFFGGVIFHQLTPPYMPVTTT